jgi:hypothetical protein
VSEIISTTIIAIMCLLWLFLAFLLLKAVILDIRSRQWPTTRGTIALSEIEVVATTTGHRYREVLQYEYVIDGVTYQSHTISFPDHLVQFFMNGVRSKKNAEGIIHKYPVGYEVSVRYEPSNPRRSTLETGVKDINFVLILAITIVLGTGLLIGLLSLYTAGIR